MLPSSAIRNYYGRFITKENGTLSVLTYNCPCRYEWISNTSEWLRDYNLEWVDCHFGTLYLDFIDADLYLMFKLAFGGSLPKECRH